MSKAIKRTLCCGIALLEMSPMFSQALSPIRVNARVRVNGYYSLPKDLKQTLNDYYGYKKASKMTNPYARNRAQSLENDWNSFNNSSWVKKHYGHLTRYQYMVRRRNESSIGWGDMDGYNGNKNVQLYGWLNKSLNKAQRNAIASGQPASGLTKTQKLLLNKYGITNQRFANNNLSDLANNKVSDISFPARAHLSNKAKNIIRGNQEVYGLSQRQIKVLGEFGIPVENGKSLSASYVDYEVNMKLKNARANGYKGKAPTQKDAKSTNPKIQKKVSQYESDANKGIAQPKAYYAEITNSDGSKSIITLSPYDVKHLKRTQGMYDDGAHDFTYLGTTIPSDLQTQSDKNEASEIANDLKNNNPSDQTVEESDTGSQNSDNNLSPEFPSSDNNNSDGVPSSDYNNQNTNSNDEIADDTAETASDQSNPSDDIDSNKKLSPQVRAALDHSRQQQAQLKAQITKENQEREALIKKQQAAEKAYQEAKQKAYKDSNAESARIARNRANHAKHVADINQARAKAMQDSISGAKHDAHAITDNAKKVTSNIDNERDKAYQDSQAEAKTKHAVNNANDVAQEALKVDVNSTPTLTDKEAKEARAYFKAHPNAILHPDKITNPAAKKFVEFASKNPNVVVSKHPNKTAHTDTKNKKSQIVTNNQLTADDINRIHSLYKQIQQIESKSHHAKEHLAKVNSIENLPYDGYSKTRQAYGTYGIFSKPEDTPRAKLIVSRSTINALNRKSGNFDKFLIANQKATTSDGNIYYHVMTMDGSVSGWINAKGLTTVKIDKASERPIGSYTNMHYVRHASRALNPDFVNAYEGLLQRYVAGDRKLQRVLHHKFNKHQKPLTHMYSPKDLRGQDKALDNIATRLQEIVRLKMNIPQFEHSSLTQANLRFKTK